ncbi:MAG: hypothetical protein QXS23_04555 [Desulfurococcaceae archaeon]
MIDVLLEQLKRRYTKVISERQGDYVLVILTHNNAEFALCINNAKSEYLYGKMISIEKLHIFDCEELELSPHGLYIYAKTPEEFIEKLPVKLKYLKP